MKRILIFSLAYYPHVGGAEVALKELTDRITDIEFHMLTLRFGNEPREETVGNIFVHRIGNGGSYLSKILFVPRAARAARTMHRALHFDALWAMMSYMVFPIVLMRMRRVRVPYVLTLQDGDPFSRTFDRWFIVPFRPLLSIGFRRAAAISALSTYLAVWAERMGYPREVAIIPNGADLTQFIATTHPVLETAGMVNLVTASRLVYKNALDDVIRALVFLPTNVQFVIYGSGPEERKLRELAAELHVGERVLCKGYVPHTELARAFATAHIFIRASRTEGFGASFVEAMAAGLPVVATQEGGIADFLFDEKRNPGQPTTGWAVDTDSPIQIADAVKDIMTNPDKVARVRANALALVREKYDWDLIAKQMRALFRYNRYMKVVIATPLYPPEIGGPATYAAALSRLLPAEGIAVEVVKFSEVRYLPKLIRHFVYYRNLLRAAADADLILALDPASVGLPAMKAAAKLGKPFIVKIVGDYAWEQGVQRFGVTESLDAFVQMKNLPLPVTVLKKVQTRVARSATRVIVPSQYLKYVVSTWGIAPEKIEVIYNAVPFGAPGAVPEAIAALPRPLIISAGRLVPWKGFKGVIDAIQILREGGTKASLAIIGDGPERDSLKEYAREVLGAHGVYFSGTLPHAETLAAIQSADAFALNSLYEGLSHLLIEALSLGAPVVATRAGGNGEVISDDKNGLLVPVGNTEHLAHALTCVVRDQALHTRLAKAAKESSERFSEEAMATATTALLTSL